MFSKEERFLQELIINENLFYKDLNHESLIKISSEHFLLPFVFKKFFLRFKKKIKDKLLFDYLEKINEVNCERNKNLIKEIFEISDLFKKNKITHIFLKGSSNIIENLYDNNSMRMVGDIDIIIIENQIIEAFNLLENTGYIKLKARLGKYHRHLNRLVNPDKIFAVELHRKLLRSNNDLLNIKDLFKKKREINGVNLLDPLHNLMYNIYSHQINDYGHIKSGYNYKSIFDVISISKKYEFDLKRISNFNYLTRLYFLKTNYLNITNIYLEKGFNLKISEFRILLSYRFKVIGQIDKYLIYKSFKLIEKLKKIICLEKSLLKS